jgi:hypothetical protein
MSGAKGPEGLFMKLLVAASIAGITMLATPAFAQMAHGHEGHVATGEGTGEGTMPQAPGQDIFGAIAEIVGILENDPETDWSRVDIGALHRHLLDMDALVTQANVVEENIAKGLRMRISRGGPGGAAAGRMVPAHAPYLKAENGWTSTVEVADDEIVWVVTAPTDAEATKIRALGFYGLMATGAHHRRHHLAIARGEAMH